MFFRALTGGLIALAATASIAAAQDGASLEDAVDGLERSDGVFPIYLDHEEGRILALFAPDEEGGFGRYIYTARLTSGLGSNPIGLDRGWGTGGEILAITRAGGQAFFEFENLRYRALGAEGDEALATEQSFGRSIIWSAGIEARGPDGGLLVDITDFIARDAVDAAGRISGAGEGSFSFDAGRSAVLTDAALTFPLNNEFDALVTLSSSSPGYEVRSTAPAPESVTLTVHHSFIALPEDGYEIRRSDTRSGGFEMTVYDMASPLSEPVRTGFAMRHRLERIDPEADSGPVVEPIVYYVDRGAPEPIRTALIEGAAWWADAFEAAGYEDAFRVEVLPEGVHPLDARYNIINWVHRQTRGWSYGGSVADPRTGEIIKGNVILGSQRVRQDRMIFEALLGAESTGTGGQDDPLEIALARIRQLSAHEVGHTLGLAHNFAASVSDRASVMDYPAPLVRLNEEGGFDLSEAYDVGIGAWDRVSVSWLYGEFGEGAEEAAALEAILAGARRAGLRYISDRHARGNGSGHPLAHLWDNGADPVAELRETIAVRNAALNRFDTAAMAPGRPLGDLRNAFPPIYLFHRYQVEAAAAQLGAVDFDYEHIGVGAAGLTPWPGAAQREAAGLLASTLAPGFLDIPDRALSLLAPDPFTDYDRAAQREHVPSSAYPAFSRNSAAAAAAEITLDAMLHPARLARMEEQSASDSGQPGAGAVYDAIEGVVFDRPRDEDARLRQIRETVQTVYAGHLLELAATQHPVVAPGARARLDSWPGARRTGASDAFQSWIESMIEGRLEEIDSGEEAAPETPDVPPGSPIGEDCWHCDTVRVLSRDR